MRYLKLILCLAFLALLASIFYQRLHSPNGDSLPSPLLNKPLPDFSEPNLLKEGDKISKMDLLGKPFLLNVWATWCPSCRAEHNFLLNLAQTNELRLVGINYKDDPSKAKRWLKNLGNPYQFNIVDLSGSFGLDLGVYGAPETFLVDSTGVIRYKQIGPLNAKVWKEKLAPVLKQMAKKRTKSQ